MNRILFPADQVKDIVEFAWRAYERLYGCSRGELKVWPELALNGSLEGGILLFPVVEVEGPLPRVYAVGCDPGRDADWKENCERLLKRQPLVIPIPIECILERSRRDRMYLEIIGFKTIEISLRYVRDLKSDG